MIGNTFAEHMRAIARENASMVTHLHVRTFVAKQGGISVRACGAQSGSRVDDPAAVTCEACRTSVAATRRG